MNNMTSKHATAESTEQDAYYTHFRSIPLPGNNCPRLVHIHQKTIKERHKHICHI